MLILNRKLDESIILDDDIIIKVVGIQDGRVKLGIEAPDDVVILRKELYDEVSEENTKSIEINKDLIDILKKGKKS